MAIVTNDFRRYVKPVALAKQGFEGVTLERVLMVGCDPNDPKHYANDIKRFANVSRAIIRLNAKVRDAKNLIKLHPDYQIEAIDLKNGQDFLDG